MAFLNENEWIRLNEIAYNISFIYTVEEMQHEILNRWLPFLISYDSAILPESLLRRMDPISFRPQRLFICLSRLSMSGCRKA